mgnify:CR=1 FL=1
MRQTSEVGSNYCFKQVNYQMTKSYFGAKYHRFTNKLNNQVKEGGVIWLYMEMAVLFDCKGWSVMMKSNRERQDAMHVKVVNAMLIILARNVKAVSHAISAAKNKKSEATIVYCRFAMFIWINECGENGQFEKC